MTIREVLKKYPKIEIDLFLSHILGKSKEFLFMNPEYKLSKVYYTSVINLIHRRQKGEPVAYILGYKDFYGLRFKVNKNVLIPRPETEWVVEEIGLRVKGIGSRTVSKIQNSKFKILDVGTGSGAIIISIAKFLQAAAYRQRADLIFLASDTSSKAITVAKANAKAHKVSIKFKKSDLLSAIKEPVDILIANLPYGWKEWKNNSSAETVGLQFEPKQALFTKENGLFLIRELLEQVSMKKVLPGYIYLEFDPRQKTALSKLIKKYLPNSKAFFHKDFRKMWRYVEIVN